MEALGPALSAGVTLLGGIFNNMAQAKREAQARAEEQMRAGYGASAAASQNMAGNTQNALQSLMEAYKSALQRPQY